MKEDGPLPRDLADLPRAAYGSRGGSATRRRLRRLARLRRAGRLRHRGRGGFAAPARAVRGGSAASPVANPNSQGRAALGASLSPFSPFFFGDGACTGTPFSIDHPPFLLRFHLFLTRDAEPRPCHRGDVPDALAG